MPDQELSAPPLKGKRILIISQRHLNPVLERNIRYLVGQGAALDVVCLRGTSPRHPIPGARIYGLPLVHRRSHLVRYLAEYGLFFVVAGAFSLLLTRRHQYSVVEVDNLPDFLVFSALPARFRKCRIVLFMYELIPDMVIARVARANHPLVRLTSAVERLATHWVDHVITVSEPCRRRLATRGTDPNRVTVLPNAQPGINCSPRDLPESPLLVTHGTIVERYGVDVAIRAVSCLRQKWPDLMLEVLGEGEQLPALKQLVCDLGLARHVRFEPFTAWQVAIQRIRRATLGIVPVLADGYGELLLPTKLLEYALHGIPAVCSNVPAIAEYFPPDSVAYFTPGSHLELAQQIDRLLANPEEAQELARRASEALRRISWEQAAPDYVSALGLSAA
jgi:glycosyltransferase involved in cell wall biosynthesis